MNDNNEKIQMKSERVNKYVTISIRYEAKNM